MCGSSGCKLFKKLSFGSRKVSMIEWRLVDHKEVCYLMFPWAVGLKIHSVLYKVFLNESIGEYLSFVNNFIKNYYVAYSKLVWNRGTILSENGSTASNLWNGLWASFLIRHSIYCITLRDSDLADSKYLSLAFHKTITYSIPRLYATVAFILVRKGQLSWPFMDSDFNCS
jgi:hypothetical protein